MELLWYITLPETVNTPSVEIVMNMCITKIVKERMRQQKESKPRPRAQDDNNDDELLLWYGWQIKGI